LRYSPIIRLIKKYRGVAECDRRCRALSASREARGPCRTDSRARVCARALRPRGRPPPSQGGAGGAYAGGAEAQLIAETRTSRCCRIICDYSIMSIDEHAPLRKSSARERTGRARARPLRHSISPSASHADRAIGIPVPSLSLPSTAFYFGRDAFVCRYDFYWKKKGERKKEKKKNREKKKKKKKGTLLTDDNG